MESSGRGEAVLECFDIGGQQRKSGFRRRIAVGCGEQQGDLLEVLRGGGQQALLLHFAEAAHPGVAVSVQLFGIGEAALHGLLSAFVDALADPLQAMGVDALAARLPHMPGDHFGMVGAARAAAAQRALAALFWVGVVLPVAFAVGGAVGYTSTGNAKNGMPKRKRWSRIAWLT